MSFPWQPALEEDSKMERPEIHVNENPPPYTPNPTSMTRLPQRISGVFDGRRHSNFQQMTPDDESDKRSLAEEKKICGIPWNKTTCIILAVTVFLFIGGILAGVLGVVLSRQAADSGGSGGDVPPMPMNSTTGSNSSTTGPGGALGPPGGGNGTVSLTATGCGTNDIFVIFQDTTGRIFYRFFEDQIYEDGGTDPWGNITEITLDLPPKSTTPLAAACWNNSDDRIFSVIYAGQSNELIAFTADCDSSAINCTSKNEYIAPMSDNGPQNLSSIGYPGTIATTYLDSTGVQIFYVDQNSTLQALSALPSSDDNAPSTPWQPPHTIMNMSIVAGIAAVAIEDDDDGADTFLFYTDDQQNLQSMRFPSSSVAEGTDSAPEISTEDITQGPVSSPVVASVVSTANSSAVLEVQYHIEPNSTVSYGYLDNTWDDPVHVFYYDPPLSDRDAPMAACPWRGNMRLFYLSNNQIVEVSTQTAAYQDDLMQRGPGGP